LALPLEITRRFLVTPSVEFARMHRGWCELTDTLCERRPDAESMLSLGIVVGVEAGTGAHPFLEVGPTIVHTFRAGSTGDRVTFLAPKVEVGLRPAGPGGRWSVLLRWRQLERSPLRSPGREYALMIGFQPRRR
jgi:hypothetical protein